MSNSLKGISKDLQDDVIKLITKTNWLDDNAKQEFAENFDSLTAGMKDASVSGAEFAEACWEIAIVQEGAIEKMDVMVRNIASVSKSIQKAGDTISAEEYNLLSANLQSYFI
jgi:histidinol dehydrogenase